MTEELDSGSLEKPGRRKGQRAGPVTAETELEKLGIHSLELTEIVMDIEDKYGVEIDLSTVDTWQSFKSVGDIIDAVKSLLAAKA